MGGSRVEGLSQLRQRHGRALCQRALKIFLLNCHFILSLLYLILAALIKQEVVKRLHEVYTRARKRERGSRHKYTYTSSHLGMCQSSHLSIAELSKISKDGTSPLISMCVQGWPSRIARKIGVCDQESALPDTFYSFRAIVQQCL